MESFFTILALKRVYEVHSISINLRKHSTNKSFLSSVLKKKCRHVKQDNYRARR